MKLNNIIKEIDFDQNKKINYTEFIVATIDVRKTLTDAKIKALFSTFDIENSGYITPENLREVFARIDKPISQKDLDHILAKHDTEEDGSISYDEFKNMLLNQEKDLVKAVFSHD